MLVGVQQDYVPHLDGIIETIKKLQFFAMKNGHIVFREGSLPDPKSSNYRKARRDHEIERQFIKSIITFVTFAHAPNEEQKDLMILDIYEQLRKPHADVFDDLGNRAWSPSDRVKDYENFRKDVERASSKIMTAFRNYKGI